MRAAAIETYERLRRAIDGQRLPCAVVDLEAFDANVRCCLEAVGRAGKTLRIATKSIRVPALLRRVLEADPEICRGLLCYAVAEACYLADHGFEDLLVAYPTVQAADLEALAGAAGRGQTIRLAVDSVEHLEAVDRAGRAGGVVLPVVLDIDVSLRWPGLVIGARRSPVSSPADVGRLARAARSLGHVRLEGLMGYEAHVAGLPDTGPIVRFLKARAIPRAADLRARAVEALREAGIEPALVNGGGTGSLASTGADPSVTEISAGSAFYHPHLFDRYDRTPFRPAASFACQVVRRPDARHVTCHGGGLVASGAAGGDRLPLPWLPPGLALTRREGAGEVQTPLRGEVGLRPGEPVFFRHAKAGELAEAFDEMLLVEGPSLVDRVPTYRGLGQRFL